MILETLFWLQKPLANLSRALFELRKKYPIKNECYNSFNNQDFWFLEMINLLIDGKTDFWTFLLCKTVTKEKTISIVIDIHTVCQRLKISIVNIKFVKHLHLLFIDISVSQLILSLHSIIALFVYPDTKRVQFVI